MEIKVAVVCFFALLAISHGLALKKRHKRQVDLGPRRAKTCTLADLAFVIDSSRSIGITDFNKELQFMKQLLDEYEIGRDKTRVAVVSFSSFVQREFNFNAYNTEAEVRQAVATIEYASGPATLTYRGLNETRRHIFTPGNGDRPDVPNIAIVISDGGTNPGRIDPYTRDFGKDLTLGEARRLKQMGVHVFTIGVGPYVDPSELRGIASDPPEKYYLQVDNFGNLLTRTLTELIADRSCLADEPIEPPNPICRMEAADIVFVLDKSTSLMSDKNFDEERRFVNRIIDSVAIGRNDMQVGVITFSTEAKFEFGLNKYANKEALKMAVRRLEWTTGDTYTDLALDMMLTKAFSPENGARPNVEKIGIIVTDGASTNPYLTKEMSNRIHRRRDIDMYAIGVGDAINQEELNMMASKPSSEYVFRVKDVMALRDISVKLSRDRFCSPTVPPRPVTPKPRDCDYADLDVFFILDKSTSLMSQANFNKELVFVEDFLKEIDIDSGSSRIGVMTFSDDPMIEFNLESYSTTRDVKAAIKTIKYTHGNTMTHKAFDLLMQEFKPRSNVEKVVIIITDGKSTDPYALKRTMASVKRRDYKIFAIGVGEAIDSDELKLIASDPDDLHVFRVDDLNALATIRITLASRICSGRTL